MTVVTGIPKLKIDAPRCTLCAGRTKLVGLEPKPSNAAVDLLTFECMDCIHYEVAEVPGGQYAGPDATIEVVEPARD
jgi:hypothetical protein